MMLPKPGPRKPESGLDFLNQPPPPPKGGHHSVIAEQARFMSTRPSSRPVPYRVSGLVQYCFYDTKTSSRQLTLTLHCASTCRVYNAATFGISRDPARKAGNILEIQFAKAVPDALEIVRIDLPKFRREPPIVDRPHLVETDVFVLILHSDMNVPASITFLRRCRSDQIKSVR